MYNTVMNSKVFKTLDPTLLFWLAQLSSLSGWRSSSNILRGDADEVLLHCVSQPLHSIGHRSKSTAQRIEACVYGLSTLFTKETEANVAGLHPLHCVVF